MPLRNRSLFCCCSALLLGGSTAVRSGERELAEEQQLGPDEPVPVGKLFKSPSRETAVCGGRTIRDFLTAPKSVTEVRNIPWVQVFAIADEFLRTQATEVERLKVEVSRLDAEIPQRERLEATHPLPLDEAAKGITKALTAEGSFGSLDIVKASQCGARLTNPRSPRGAYKVAVAAFQSGVKELLQSGRVSVRSQTFVEGCSAFLAPAGATDGPTNCGELCQAFADAAQAASDELAGTRAVTSKSVDQLRREREQVVDALSIVLTEIKACQDLRADVDVFRVQLDALKKDVTATNDKLMDARDALLDAQANLADAEAECTAKTGAATLAATILQATGDKATAAQAEFQKVSQAAVSSRTALQQAGMEMKTAQLQLQSAQGAIDTLRLLKDAVSVSMLNMKLYYEEAVRDPLRKLGLGEDGNINQFFAPEPKELRTAKATRRGIEALNSFCDLPQTRSSLVAGKVSPEQARRLCAIGNVTQIEEDIDAVVAQKITMIRRSLKEVQSIVVDTYKGQQGYDAAKVRDSVQKGEPVGLREVISAFGSTLYYRKYLMEWKLQGRFQKAYRTLLVTLTQAQSAQQQTATKLSAVKAQLEVTEKAEVSAKAALVQAIEAKQLAAGKEAEAQELLKAINANADGLRRELSELEAAFALATKRYETALQALAETHREGTSFLEMLAGLEASAPQSA